MDTHARAVAAVLVILAPVTIQDASAADRTRSKRAMPKSTVNRGERLKTNASKMKQYKRVHQYALDEITSDRPALAVAHLDKYAALSPKDAETRFVLGLALARLGQKDAAVAAMRKALDLGIPPSRLIAGPRDMLGPLGESTTLRSLLTGNPNWLATLNGSTDLDSTWQPLHGPMVGNVTDRTADIWFRAALAGTYRAVVWEIDKPGGKPSRVVCTVKATASPKADYTVVISLSDLRADRCYAYSIGPENSQPAAMTDARYFRTAPAPGVKSKFTLVFGGGAGFVPDNERMWNRIDDKKPNLLLLLGDNVYSDRPENPHMQRYCYYRRQSRPEFRALVAHTPVYTIWDDHDFGINDCWGGSEIEFPAWKRPVWNIFRENWVNPGYGGGKSQPGCWYAFKWGDVEFFMLDCRYYRTDPKVSNPSMLGPVQRKWLKEVLGASKATFKVICSSVPFEYRTKGKSLDTWNGFRAEREEIFGFINGKKIDGVLLMSADRHRSDLWKIERERGYAFYELNSSRLTNQHVHKTMSNAIFSYNKKQSFGLVEFDTSAADPTARYSIVTIGGETVHSFTVKRSRLCHKGH